MVKNSDPKTIAPNEYLQNETYSEQQSAEGPNSHKLPAVTGEIQFRIAPAMVSRVHI